MLHIYGIKNCDTVKKALHWLDQHGLNYTFHDYKKPGVVDAQLERWCQHVGWETLLNTRGLMWRKIDASEKESLDEALAKRLMIQYPSIIKRPVVDTGQQVWVGFQEDLWAKRLEQTDSN